MLSISRVRPKRTASGSSAPVVTGSSSDSSSGSATETYSISASGSAASTSVMAWRRPPASRAPSRYSAAAVLSERLRDADGDRAAGCRKTVQTLRTRRTAPRHDAQQDRTSGERTGARHRRDGGGGG